MPAHRNFLFFVSSSGVHDPIAARVPFFYGWVMLPIGIAGLIATSPGQTYGICVFNDAFRHDFLTGRLGRFGFRFGSLRRRSPCRRRMRHTPCRPSRLRTLSDCVRTSNARSWS